MTRILTLARDKVHELVQSGVRFMAWRAIERRLRRSRYLLEAMSDHQLHDIGLRRYEPYPTRSASRRTPWWR